jgi:hypothetical protein
MSASILSISSKHYISSKFSKFLLGAAASLGLLGLAFDAIAQPQGSDRSKFQVASELQTTGSTAAKLADGVYLYGQSVQPNQVGSAYFVFEVRHGKVLGALYMPQSSFDCAYGHFQADQLALNVIDSYEKTISPFTIGLAKTAQVASTNNPAMIQLGLEGFNRLDQISDNDRRILNVCQTQYEGKAFQ